MTRQRFSGHGLRRPPINARRQAALFGSMMILWSTPLSPVGNPGWQWPLRPAPGVVRGFDAPETSWGPGHRGVDLAARPGRPVYAAGTGRVGYAGPLAGRGVVTVRHGALRTTYLPVRPSVRPGQKVAAGDRIGVVQDLLGHCGRRGCLHWGLLRGPEYLDPLSLLGWGPVRLLPVWGTPAPPAVPRRPAAGSAGAGDGGDQSTGQPADGMTSGSAADRSEGSPGLSLAAAVTGGGVAATALLALVLAAQPFGRGLRRRQRPRLPAEVVDFARERERRRPADHPPDPTA